MRLVSNSIRFGIVAGALLLPLAAQSASALPDCQPAPTTTALQQDRLLRVADILRQELVARSEALAIISRSGLDLARFGLRYSHAGLSLRNNQNGAWSVRQLYFACDERKPRIFDQGMAGFVLGTDNPDAGFVSLQFLPAHAALPLEAQALDNSAALSMLSANYSANAYAFSTQYQNCNQWLIELMARAWGQAMSRLAAQSWLQREGYQATSIEVTNPWLLWLASFSPWLREDDHPVENRDKAIFQVSMPSAIEKFLARLFPELERVELCYTTQHVLIRRNGLPLAANCSPAPGDTLIPWTE